MSLRNFLLILWVLFIFSYLLDWDSPNYGENPKDSASDLEFDVASQVAERQVISNMRFAAGSDVDQSLNDELNRWLEIDAATDKLFPLEVEGAVRGGYYMYNLSSFFSLKDRNDTLVAEYRGDWSWFSEFVGLDSSGTLAAHFDVNQSIASPNTSLIFGLFQLSPRPLTDLTPVLPSLFESRHFLNIHVVGLHFRRKGLAAFEGITNGHDIYLPNLLSSMTTEHLFEESKLILNDTLTEWIKQNNETLQKLKAGRNEQSHSNTILNPDWSTRCNFTGFLQLGSASSSSQTFEDLVALHEQEYVSQAMPYALPVDHVSSRTAAYKTEDEEPLRDSLGLRQKVQLPKSSMILYSKNCDLLVSSFPLQNGTFPISSSVLDVEFFPFAVRLNRLNSFAFLSTLIIFAQTVFMIRQKKFTLATQARVHAISPYSILILMISDALWCVAAVGISSTMESLAFPYLALAFLSFCSFSIVSMRLLMAVVRQTVDAVREREVLIRLYTQFYVAVFLSIGILRVLLATVAWTSVVFLLPYLSLWVPQIIKNFTTDQRHTKSFSRENLFVQSVARLFPIVYLFCYNGNPFYWSSQSIKTDFSVFVFIVSLSYLLLQVVILETQRMWGGKWFMPAQYRPKRFNYKRQLFPSDLADNLKVLDKSKTSERSLQIDFGEHPTQTNGSRLIQSNVCAVCFHPVLPIVNNEAEPEDASVDLEQLPMARNYMVTPCQHLFHTKCLRRWLHIKLDCPTCRGPLPPT